VAQLAAQPHPIGGIIFGKGAKFDTETNRIEADDVGGVVTIAAEDQLAGGACTKRARVDQTNRDIVVARRETALGSLTAERDDRLTDKAISIVAFILRDQQPGSPQRKAPIAGKPTLGGRRGYNRQPRACCDNSNREFTRHVVRSEEHTSELQSRE